MEPIVGVFESMEDAQRGLPALRSAGFSNDGINFLTPQSSARAIAEVPATGTEQEGMGKVFGGVVGGAIGSALGAELGLIMASVFVPGIGPVLTVGAIAAALFGAGGVIGGAAAGKALEEGIENGLPIDELYVYLDALRIGRTVVIAMPHDDIQADSGRQALRNSGAESIDEARDHWWLGLRHDEEEHYRVRGQEFSPDEAPYREGFVAALRSENHDRSYGEALSNLRKSNPDECGKDAFRLGYTRGCRYRERISIADLVGSLKDHPPVKTKGKAQA